MQSRDTANHARPTTRSLLLTLASFLAVAILTVGCSGNDHTAARASTPAANGRPVEAGNTTTTAPTTTSSTATDATVGSTAAIPATTPSISPPAATGPAAAPPSPAPAAVAAAVLQRPGVRAIVAPPAQGDPVTQCVGQTLITSVGPDGAMAMLGAGTALSAPQLAAISTALDRCVPGTTVAGPLASILYHGNGPAAPPAVVSCMAGALDGRVGQVLAAAVRDPGGSFTDQALAVLDRCVPPADVATLIRTALVDGGVSPTQAACATDGLRDLLTVSDLVRISRNQAGPAVEAKVRAVLVSCA